MRIPKDTHVVLATYPGYAEIPRDGWIRQYEKFFAGRLTEDFLFRRGETFAIDGPLGGAFPTREVPLAPVMSGTLVVGVSFVLPEGLHLLMVEPFDPTPIPPDLAWPAHIKVVRDKMLSLQIGYKDRDATVMFRQLA
jgi:hypothetical protein